MIIRNSKLNLGMSKFESGASDLPPEGLKKRSCCSENLDFHRIIVKLKIRPRDVEIRVRSVRFTPRGFEKRSCVEFLDLHRIIINRLHILI